MKWFLMLLIFIAGIYYIVNQHKREAQIKQTTMLSKEEKLRTLADPVLPTKPDKPYVMKFSMQTIKTLRTLTQDSNERVRFASAELLWQLQDESAPSIIKNMFENETELPVKKQLIDMLAKDKSKLSLALLTVALKDYDRDIRLKAVGALGDFSNKEAIPALSTVLEDTDEEVRLKALEAVNRTRQDIEAHKEQQLRELESQPHFRIE